MYDDNFEHIYIFSKGRPQCQTARLLRRYGYPYGFSILVERDDETLNDYLENWGELVEIYDRGKAFYETDMCDAFGFVEGRNGDAPARNAAHHHVSKSGRKRAWFADDDITGISYPKSSESEYGRRRVTDGETLYRLLHALVEVAVAADLPKVGTVNDISRCPMSRTGFRWYVKCFYNIDLEHPQKFMGRLTADDISTINYYRSGATYGPHLSFECVAVSSVMPNKQSGGMTETTRSIDILATGYNVMVCPSAIKLFSDRVGKAYVRWVNVVPKLIRDEWKKHD